MNHRKYPCSECERAYDNIIDYADHKLNRHGTKIIKHEGKWVKCADLIS